MEYLSPLCGQTFPNCQPNPDPAYDPKRNSYNTIDAYGPCGNRPSLADVVSRKSNSNATWTSKGAAAIGSGSTLLNGLGRSADMSQLVEGCDHTYPFTFGYLCSTDGGSTFAPAACRYTNATTRFHEVAGNVPVAWDGLAGFDLDRAVNGFVTLDGFVTKFGNPVGAGICLIPGADCFPIKASHYPIGKYGAALPGAKVSNPNCQSNPSRNVWFKNGVYLPGGCASADGLAVPSGWIGPNN